MTNVIVSAPHERVAGTSFTAVFGWNVESPFLAPAWDAITWTAYWWENVGEAEKVIPDAIFSRLTAADIAALPDAKLKIPKAQIAAFVRVDLPLKKTAGTWCTVHDAFLRFVGTPADNFNLTQAWHEVPIINKVLQKDGSYL